VLRLPALRCPALRPPALGADRILSAQAVAL